jgi:hypothetical protein
MAFAAFVARTGVLIAAAEFEATPNGVAFAEHGVAFVQYHCWAPCYRSPSGPVGSAVDVGYEEYEIGRHGVARRKRKA